MFVNITLILFNLFFINQYSLLWSFVVFCGHLSFNFSLFVVFVVNWIYSNHLVHLMAHHEKYHFHQVRTFFNNGDIFISWSKVGVFNFEETMTFHHAKHGFRYWWRPIIALLFSFNVIGVYSFVASPKMPQICDIRWNNNFKKKLV